MVKTRFAPSPTGNLHIGSIRTILFNWLFAKSKQGKFLIRVEDTDKERSKLEYTKNIFDSMKWLGLNWDDEVVYQSQNIERHKEVAYQLLNAGKAYKCYCTQEELEAERQKAMQEKRTPKYNRKCRNLTKEQDKPFTIRLKTQIDGITEFEDLVQGHCKVNNEHMDDMILLRSDGTPTYMLAVVVDDHDMQITNIIRGSEHLNNAYRQIQIYKACEWNIPEFAHISLIHGEDGAKLSKRHGAVGLDEYQKQGFFPEAILNYLLRLGWSYGDDEIISLSEASKIFDFSNVNSSPARFSQDKLYSVNSIYLKKYSNESLIEMLKEYLGKNAYEENGWARLLNGMNEIKARTRTLIELAKMSAIYGNDLYYAPIEKSPCIEEIAQQAIENPWGEDAVSWLKQIIEKHNKTLKEVAPDLRMALTKEKVAPSIFELMKVLGNELFAARLSKAMQ